jgi:hypothetical protein
MMDKIEFRVEQHLPPKKDGANSMWAKSVEVPRLIALRRSAVTAMAGRRPFRANIALELEVHYPAAQGHRIGDLDNFVAGVCDGLMAAVPRSNKDPQWDMADYALIHPLKCIAIEDDDAVVSIVARKVVGGSVSWYHITLEGE